MEFDHPDGRVVLVTMPEFSAWVAASDEITRHSIGDSYKSAQTIAKHCLAAA
ncbi:hypothetical protein [Bradyrhizobium sp. USDA 10063]